MFFQGLFLRIPPLLMLLALLSCGVAQYPDNSEVPTGNRSAIPLSSLALSPLENAVIHEINLARQHPDAYATFLEAEKKYYDGKLIRRPGEIAIVTHEGTGAVDEAIKFLKCQPPLHPLRPSRGLALAAREHLRDIQRNGIHGHVGSDGSQTWDRVNRHGAWRGAIAEAISYGPEEGRQIVMALIIDDGVADRGHRMNIYWSKLGVIGVSYGNHDVYGKVCVIDFAGEYEDKIGN